MPKLPFIRRDPSKFNIDGILVSRFFGTEEELPRGRLFQRMGYLLQRTKPELTEVANHFEREGLIQKTYSPKGKINYKVTCKTTDWIS